VVLLLFEEKDKKNEEGLFRRIKVRESKMEKIKKGANDTKLA